MIDLLCLTGVLLLHVQVPVDTAKVYAAVLHDIRSEYPGAQLALSATAWDVKDGEPPCADTASPRRHSAATLERLRSARLIDAVCVVPENYVNCPDEAGKLFVAVGGVRRGPPPGADTAVAGVWVLATVIPPCGGDCRVPEVTSTWYLLVQEGYGAWKVAGKRPDRVS